MDSKQMNKKKLSIECCEIGCVGEYDHKQCNKSWRDVALTEFSIDNKEK